MFTEKGYCAGNDRNKPCTPVQGEQNHKKLQQIRAEKTGNWESGAKGKKWGKVWKRGGGKPRKVGGGKGTCEGPGDGVGSEHKQNKGLRMKKK